MHEDELRFWANAHVQAGSEVAAAVLDLFGKIDSLRAAEKVTPPVLDRAPSEVEELFQATSRAYKKLLETQDKPFDGSTGTPAHGTAGHKNPPPPGTNQ